MLIGSYDGSHLMPGELPGIAEVVEQDLTSVIWQPLHRCVVGANRPIDGATRDTGNTVQPNVLRPGLLLSKNPGGTKFVLWQPGVNLIEGVLLISQNVTLSGTNADRFMGHIMLGGFVKNLGLIVPGQTNAGIVGNPNEMLIREQMFPAFKFDDDPLGHLVKDYGT